RKNYPNSSWKAIGQRTLLVNPQTAKQSCLIKNVDMSPFEFVCAFYSVVLGVAVAQLMTSVGRLIEVRDQVRTYWVQSLWVVIVFLVDVKSWWSMWELRNAKRWIVFSFILLVCLDDSINLYYVLILSTYTGFCVNIIKDARYC